jgi:hypothetical protein
VSNAPYWFPVVTLALGAIGGFLADFLREGRAADREREAARHAFQRESLIALQDWLAKLSRATGAIHAADEMHFRQTGEWGRQQLGEELNLAFHEAVTNVQRFRVRVLDDAIRKESADFVAACTAAAVGAMRDELDNAARARGQREFERLPKVSMELNEKLGAALRERL